MVWSKNESRMGYRRMKLDREKVIKSAEICLKHIDESDCSQECPYFEQCSKYERRVIFQPLIRDALALLKEQEEKMKHLNNITLEYEKEVFRLQTLLKEQEAKTGHWIYLQYCANEGVYCSECHTKMFDRYPMKKKLSQFCGHCGAKMEG